MSLKAVLKVVNFFLALAAFLTVGAVLLVCGEEPVWAVGKAIVCFLACWIVVGYLAYMLSLAVEGPEEQSGLRAGDAPPSARPKKGK